MKCPKSNESSPRPSSHRLLLAATAPTANVAAALKMSPSRLVLFHGNILAKFALQICPQAKYENIVFPGSGLLLL